MLLMYIVDGLIIFRLNGQILAEVFGRMSIARFILINAQANLQLTMFNFNHMISSYRLVLLIDTIHNNLRLARYTIFACSVSL